MWNFQTGDDGSKNFTYVEVQKESLDVLKGHKFQVQESRRGKPTNSLHEIMRKDMNMVFNRLVRQVQLIRWDEASMMMVELLSHLC